MHIEKFITGPIETNSYLVVSDKKKCLIVDPSSGCDEIIDYIDNNELVPEAIIITHGHFDHTMGIDEILNRFSKLSVYVNPDEAKLLRTPALNGSYMIGAQISYTGPVSDLKEGPMRIGSFEITIIIVPGHSPGGTALLIDKYLICGDILFAGSVGRSDLPGGNAGALLNGIHKKILVLPDDTIICPGHGGRTTVAREKRENPFL